MTNETMNKVVQAYCAELKSCDDCKIKHYCDKCRGDFRHHHLFCEAAYNLIKSNENTPTPVENEVEDIINHPNHYNRTDAMESIDEMVLVFGREAVKNFCLCNVWKYRYRVADKNGTEDIKKSDWYMRKYKELCSCE